MGAEDDDGGTVRDPMGDGGSVDEIGGDGIGDETRSHRSVFQDSRKNDFMIFCDNLSLLLAGVGVKQDFRALSIQSSLIDQLGVFICLYIVHELV